MVVNTGPLLTGTLDKDFLAARLTTSCLWKCRQTKLRLVGAPCHSAPSGRLEQTNRLRTSDPSFCPPQPKLSEDPDANAAATAPPNRAGCRRAHRRPARAPRPRRPPPRKRRWQPTSASPRPRWSRGACCGSTRASAPLPLPSLPEPSPDGLACTGATPTAKPSGSCSSCPQRNVDIQGVKDPCAPTGLMSPFASPALLSPYTVWAQNCV